MAEIDHHRGNHRWPGRCLCRNSDAAADLNDPRAQKIATAIGFAMSRQHDPLSRITAVEPSRALKTIEGAITDADFFLAGAVDS